MALVDGSATAARFRLSAGCAVAAVSSASRLS
jgi:hypothetical protein